MDNNILTEIILANAKKDNDSVTEDLQQILSVIRSHLDMDIAFISEFSRGERVFKYIDSKDEAPVIKVGDSDPLKETYCHRIVEGELPEHISDTSLNRITKELAVTDALSIGDYIGIPIRISDGSVYGTFCCFNHKADETIGERDLAMLRVFADFAGKQIDSNLKANHEQNEMIKRVISVLEPSKINIVYQPIYDILGEKITGLESNLRFFTTPYRTPDIWFNEAAQVGLGENLEMMAIDKAIKGLDQLPKDIYISLNTSPEHILSGAVTRVLEKVPSQRVVLEITEHARIADYTEFRAALDPLRRNGIRLAIDDAGAGYASFQHILELGADIIKLDISIIQNVHIDPARRALAAALIAFARATESEVIAEGVETVEEFNELQRLGVNKVQGFFISRPMSITKVSTFLQSFEPDFRDIYGRLPTVKGHSQLEFSSSRE